MIIIIITRHLNNIIIILSYRPDRLQSTHYNIFIARQLRRTYPYPLTPPPTILQCPPLFIIRILFRFLFRPTAGDAVVFVWPIFRHVPPQTRLVLRHSCLGFPNRWAACVYITGVVGTALYNILFIFDIRY